MVLSTRKIIIAGDIVIGICNCVLGMIHVSTDPRAFEAETCNGWLSGYDGQP
jgi:hypothetical protein